MVVVVVSGGWSGRWATMPFEKWNWSAVGKKLLLQEEAVVEKTAAVGQKKKLKKSCWWWRRGASVQCWRLVSGWPDGGAQRGAGKLVELCC